MIRTTHRALTRPLAVVAALSLAATTGLVLAPASGAATGSGPACIDANLDRLAKATGGEMHAVILDGVCMVRHTFTVGRSDSFTVTAAAPVHGTVTLAGGGAGGGGGSGWENSTKAAGAEPESGAGAGGAGGSVASGSLTYTPSAAARHAAAGSAPDGTIDYTPSGAVGTAPGPITWPVGGSYGGGIQVTVGAGGTGGTGGSPEPGATAGGDGGRGGDSSFGPVTASGGRGGAGGVGGRGGTDPRAGGTTGGSNSQHSGGFVVGAVDHAAPGGAGAGGDGGDVGGGGPVAGGGDGGAGGDGVAFDLGDQRVLLGAGGGGGALDPASVPSAPRAGGAGGRAGLLSDGSSCTDCVGKGGSGGKGGAGEDAPDGYGGGGGGGGTDGSVTPGDSNAGAGGRGGDGVVMVMYEARQVPLPPRFTVGGLTQPNPISGVVTQPGYPVVLTGIDPNDLETSHAVTVAGRPDLGCTVEPGEDSCILTGLEVGQQYTVMVAATNPAGSSDPMAAMTT
ncbi:MAG: hypothetical protein KGR18_11915, partial [Acidobacteria bacterium]|nr:hypothetical protein [Acidobacteriota bacterium]